MGKTEITDIVGRPALRILRAAGQISQIPGVAPLAELAINILDTARAAKNNKNDFLEIANQCCVLAAALAERALAGTRGDEIPLGIQRLIQDAQTLSSALKDIQRCMNKCAKRSWWKRIFTAWVDADIIAGCRHQLANAAQLFSVQSNLDLRTQIPEMYQLLLEVVQKVNTQTPATMAQSQQAQRPQAHLPSSSSYQVNGPNYGNVGPNHGVVGANYGSVGQNNGVVGTNYGLNMGNQLPQVAAPPHLWQLAAAEVPPLPGPALPGPRVSDTQAHHARAERLRQRAERQRQNAQGLRQQIVVN